MYTLVFVVLGGLSPQETHTHYRTNEDCRTQAQLVTGDKRKKVGLVFVSPSGNAMAFCRPTRA